MRFPSRGKRRSFSTYLFSLCGFHAKTPRPDGFSYDVENVSLRTLRAADRTVRARPLLPFPFPPIHNHSMHDHFTM
ncbi:hypothetical protein EXIGLDRAFT_764619 [Exidia glandulosa HHB12029]|uniref:Uncharacterized protein n=1 Tax=Exidia glandulosa HHB12029 TaxID=1314781 RepID=A0A165L0E3_EXIGL|nr:hypothetical protein EXIGLDRAFT_764619 [Exidia glandulosa HHB12029]